MKKIILVLALIAGCMQIVGCTSSCCATNGYYYSYNSNFDGCCGSSGYNTWY